MTITEQAAEKKPEAPKAVARQYVNFIFYNIDRALRFESEEVRSQARTEFGDIVDRYRKQFQIHTYSTLGVKAGIDFMLWRIGYEIEPMEMMTSEIGKSVLGRHLNVPASYLAMTKHSTYVEEHVHEGQEGRRLRIVAGKSKYLFVYPFVKTRPWYMLPMPERQRMMNSHIAIGHKYPTVKINTTYSFGLDDQEFVVAFETDSPPDFLDLVQELRETEASSYTLRDTPMYTCRRQEIGEILNALM
ncbi:MAG TPA: chlorite dismutase family protein [Thermoanaerobaculia bacterium]|nr:chlorite dismutase family protein [Thermoanaerobaculia bacterium]